MSSLTVQNIQGSASSSNTINVASGHKISGNVTHGTGSVFPAGHIIQVKQTVLPHASTFSSTTTSMVTTGHAVSITPSSTSNKILLNVTCNLYNASGHNIKVTIVRNHSGISETDLGTGTDQGFTQLHTPSSAIGSGGAIVFLDSPSTTNEITYTVKMRVSGGTGYYNIGGDAVLVAMEVAG